MFQKKLLIKTTGRGSDEITNRINAAVAEAAPTNGMCHLFIQHTSASLMLCENADPAVRHDLEVFMADLVPDGDSRFTHTAEGSDDMPAHVRSILTQTDLNIPVKSGHLALGTWQGIYLWEHRTGEHARTILVTIMTDGQRSNLKS